MMNKLYILKISIAIFLGVLLNVGLMYLAQYVLNLPVFMDTLGSITVAFVFGPIAAIICATISQIVMYFVEGYSSLIIVLYVITVYGAICIISPFRKTLNQTDSILSRILILFIISILMILIVSVLGGIVNVICVYVQELTGYEVQDNAATSYFQIDLLKRGLSSVPTYILSRIPNNLIERPLITVLAYGIGYFYQKIVASKSKLTKKSD
ncbi:MAG: hypothetical protein K5829_12330 [Treponema sp.]|nr:hypothetical protein [Treponema sp.]